VTRPVPGLEKPILGKEDRGWQGKKASRGRDGEHLGSKDDVKVQKKVWGERAPKHHFMNKAREIA